MNVYNFDTMEHYNCLDGAISGNSQRHRQFNFSSIVELEPLLEEGCSGDIIDLLTELVRFKLHRQIFLNFNVSFFH